MIAILVDQGKFNLSLILHYLHAAITFIGDHYNESDKEEKIYKKKQKDCITVYILS